MKLLIAMLALALPVVASAAAKDIKEYRTYDCQITGNGGGAHYVTGYFMSISIEDHIGQFFQERFELDGSQIQLQVLIEETKKTSVDGTVILLQNLKVDEEETSVEKTMKSVTQASTQNGDFASICKISK